jgi:protein-tyrosine phosphatase
VLVHCAQGVRRTGMMVAAYELSVLKLDKDQAVAAIKGFGHSDRTIGDVKRFIEVYDPQTQQMTADMPHSQE